MSGDVSIKVEGLKELEAALLGQLKEAPGHLAKGVRTPMERVLLEMKTLVPKRTGALADALELTTKRASARRASMADTLTFSGVRISHRVDSVGTWANAKGQGSPSRLRPRSYWHLVEFGTAHSAASPYIRPAFDENTDRMIGEFKSIVSAGIERTRAKYARQSARRRRRG